MNEINLSTFLIIIFSFIGGAITCLVILLLASGKNKREQRPIQYTTTAKDREEIQKKIESEQYADAFESWNNEKTVTPKNNHKTEEKKLASTAFAEVKKNNNKKKKENDF